MGVKKVESDRSTAMLIGTVLLEALQSVNANPADGLSALLNTWVASAVPLIQQVTTEEQRQFNKESMLQMLSDAREHIEGVDVSEAGHEQMKARLARAMAQEGKTEQVH